MKINTDSREEEELAEFCLTKLYGQNERIFDSLVCALYGWFRGSEEQLGEDAAYQLFTETLATAMKDAPSQRVIETKHLSGAIWNHLKVRGTVRGFLQDRQKEETIIIFQAFARFVTGRAFGKQMDLSQAGLQRAARVLVDTENRSLPIRAVETIRNPFASGPDC